MGVDLKKLVSPKQISMKDIKNKKIGIDAYNWLYQFLTIIRQPDGTPLMDSKGRITSHLSGLFYRTCKLIENNIFPCYIFDGEPPKFKIVLEEREEIRSKAEEEYLKAKEEGNLEKAFQKAMQSARLTKEMVLQAKELLEAMGVPVIQAPSEGEAQASYMTSKGDFFATASQDYDVLLFGSPRVIRNLSISGRRRMYGKYINVSPEIIVLNDLLEKYQISQKELIMMGILIGTDYNPGGVKGIGPMKALKLIKDYGVNAWKRVNWEWGFDPRDLMNFFLNPPVKKDYSLVWRPIDDDKVIDLLVGKYEFSEERVKNTLSKLKSIPKNQSTLTKFF